MTSGVRIPIAQPSLSEVEEKYVLEAVRSTWISSSGKFLDEFEERFAAKCGSDSALGVCNGTVALHLALLGLDVRAGDEVIVPSLTYVATANAVRYVGAEPVFVDVDPRTWTLDPALIEERITRRTRGIIPVHLYGHPADMDELNRLAGIHGLWVVEDAAEAPFARYKGRPTGGLADLATFSFYGNKVITSGEGGAVTVSNRQLFSRLRTLRGQGVDPARRYFFPVTGYNFRMTNVAAALLCGQLDRVNEILDRRSSIFERYEEGLRGVVSVGLQPVASWADVSPWLFSIVVGDDDSDGVGRDRVAMRLGEEGIETRPFFVPLHVLPPFRCESRSRGEELPWTESLSRRGLNLPTYPDMTDSDVDRVIDRVRVAVGHDKGTSNLTSLGSTP
jgi:perosamine synthetase